MTKAKFDYEFFGISIGDTDYFAAHAKKYTKEQVVGIYNEEYQGYYGEATVDDVSERYAKYFVRPTWRMEHDPDYTGGCYGFVDEPGNGAFPVWVIDVKEVRKRVS